MRGIRRCTRAGPRLHHNDGVTSLRDVVLLGSTGSIGTQAIEVVQQHPGPFPGDRAQRRRRQPRPPRAAGRRPAGRGRRGRRRGPERRPRRAGPGRPRGRASTASHPRSSSAPRPTPGSRARAPTWCSTASPARSGCSPPWPRSQPAPSLALANKESLIVGGPLVKAGRRARARSCPVDCEHSAIAQCLRGGHRRGGTPARRHRQRRPVPRPDPGGPRATSPPPRPWPTPTSDMGPVVTTNSATLVNKGLEVIEAHLLFDIPLRADRRRGPPAVSGPLHGRVHRRLHDRPGLAAGRCCIPIALGPRLAGPACRTPARPATGPPPRRGTSCPWTTRRSPRWPSPGTRGRQGGTYPAVFNAANEECVEAFLAGRHPLPRHRRHGGEGGRRVSDGQAGNDPGS